MTAGLETQIRDLAAAIEATQASTSLDEILHERLGGESVQLVGTVAQQVEPPRWRGLVLGAAVVASALLVVGGASLLTRVTEPESPVAGSVTSTTVTEITTTTFVPTTLLGDMAPAEQPTTNWCDAPTTWTHICDDAAVFAGAELSSVVAGGPGFVAVGSIGTFDEEMVDDAAVWTSADGLRWTRVPHDEAVFGGFGVLGDQGMSSVIVGGPGLVAVGTSGGDAAVWTSPDGITWTRVPHDGEVFGGPGERTMHSVTTGGPGLVAVGTANGDAAVWTSPDGITWTRVPHDEDVFGGPGERTMHSVAAGGPGLVAVGSDGIGEGLLSCCGTADDVSDADAAVWTSPDGLVWARVPRDEAVFGGEGAQVMLSVTAGGPGFVAVGATSGLSWPYASDAAVWTSVDGLAWSRVPHDPTVFGGSSVGFSEVWMASVTRAGPGLVAVGSSGTVQSQIVEAVWTSPDGITWTRLPESQHDCYSEMWSVTEGPSGLVAVGFAQCGEETGAIWRD